MIEFEYRSRYFALSDKSIFLIRKNFPYREISFSEVRRVLVIRGSDNKRPKLSWVVGSALILVALDMAGTMINSYSGDLVGIAGYLRMFVYLVIGVGFVGGIGCLLIYSALDIHPILQIELHDGKSETFSLSDDLENKKIQQLHQHLKNKLGVEKIAEFNDFA